MSAPDKIWAWYFMENKRDDVIKGGWDDQPDARETEYIRADLATSEADALRAEVARLREALDEIAGLQVMCASDMAVIALKGGTP